MRDRLMSMPVWGLFLVLAVPSAAVMLVIGLITGDSLPWALASAGGFGVLAGGASTSGLKLAGRMEKSAFGNASVDVRREARRAARSGPVPSDPEVRTAALRLAEVSLQKLRGTRPVLVVAAAVIVVAEIGLAFTSSPWSLLVLAVVLPTLLYQLFFFPKRLQARIALLSAAQ